jgi:Domain of unknown function (DUF4291)
MTLTVTMQKIPSHGMFDLRAELYLDSVKRLPNKGQQIIGYQDETSIVVYQAYKKSIAEFAISTQTLGGPDFSYNRMSWIKPNFLWMMFRCGWAEKENQEAVLAITISKTFFIEILKNSVISSFNADYHDNHDTWKNELNLKSVRLQWDPDHDPFGNKASRRAIQLGLKGELLEKFGTDEIISIKDVTPFVRQQKQLLDSRQLDALVIPYETIFEISDSALTKRIGISAD